MGGDENRIEIIIDAAETKSAAKSATEANQRLSEFRKALDAFKNGVGDLNKTIETNTTTVANFNTFLNDFNTKLNDNLSKMEESVIKDFEPRLEKNLENMVARAINKVEAKTSAPGKESRSRSEPKAGAGAPASNVATVAQPKGYEKPDVRAKATFETQKREIIDGLTGAITQTNTERSRSSTTRTENWQEEVDGEMVNFTRTITEVSNSVKKFGDANKKSNNWADPSNMMRREITGALIALHVIKVVAGNSQVAASGFNMISNAIGHLLNVALLPMIPIFSMFAQLIHQVANVINSMPYGIRLLIGGLVMWKATSTLIASMPIREFGSGIEQLKENLKGGSDTLNKFGEVVKALINFMNSGLRSGRVQGLAEWVGGKIRGKRAGGGPVGASNAYIVGEKGPELFVPDSSGTIVPNSAFRADGGGVEAGGGLPFGDILGNLGAGLGAGGLTYLLTGSPLLAGGVGAGAAMLGPAGIAEAMSGIISSEIGQQVIGSLNVLTGTISSLFAPLAPIFGILSVALGVVTGLKGGGGGGDKGAETTAKVGNAINSTVSRGNFGIQSVINTGNMGTNKLISMILVRLAGCLRVAPCDGANFGGAETTVIAGLLPTILASIIAIPQGINTKLGEFITEATVKIKSIWEPIPQPEALQDRVAKIRYQIETVGAVPIAENVSARIQYTIVTTGTIPEVTNRVATLEYVETVRPLTEEQVRAAIERVSNIAERYPIEIETSLKAIEPADIALLTERIETLAAVDPVEIKVKILADGTPEFTFKEVPRVISIADIRTADVSKLSPVRAPTTLYVPEGTVPLLPAGISAKLPVVYDTSRSVLPSIKDPIKLPMNPEISGFVGDGKGGYKASGRFNGGFVDMSGAKIPGWEYLGNGMYKKIGAFEGPIEFKVAEGFKLSDLFGLDKLKEAGKGFGGVIGFGILDGVKEFMTTGKINWGDFFTRNVVYLVAGGVIKMFAGAIVAEVVGAIALGVMVHEVKGLFDPIIQRALDGVDGTGFLGNLFHRLFMPENSQGVTNILGPVMGGLLVSTVETGLEILSNTPLGQKLVTAMQSAFANAGDLGNILSMGQNLAIILNPGTDLITKMEAFNNLFKKTVDGGIPVDVKMDVESMTQTIKSVASTINSDGTYTYKPTGSTQPIGTNPVSPDGKPIQGPLKPDGSFALGGPVAAGGLYLVGEKGPELFAPDVGGQIIPNNKIGGGGGSNVTNNFTFNVTTNNPKELTDTVMRELKMELARVKM